MKQGLQVFVAAVMAAACGGNPAAPTPSPAVLALGFSSVTLARNASIDTTVQLRRSDGTSEDVTSAAVWASSAPDIVAVSSGHVSAVGVGTARVTVSYQGVSAAMDVVARRNTRLAGSVRLTDVQRRSSIAQGSLLLDGRGIGGTGTSSPITDMIVNVGWWDTYRNADVTPGPHQVTARIDRIAPYGVTESRYAVSTNLQVIDTDTGEVLAKLDLAPQEQSVQASVRVVEFAWPIQVDVFR
jgi:hypothetical protein